MALGPDASQADPRGMALLRGPNSSTAGLKMRQRGLRMKLTDGDLEPSYYLFCKKRTRCKSL